MRSKSLEKCTNTAVYIKSYFRDTDSGDVMGAL